MAGSVRPSHSKSLPSRRRHQLPGGAPKATASTAPTSVRPTSIRLILVWLFLLASSAGLAYNLMRIQVVEGPLLKERARQQQMVTLRPFLPRRPIVDRLGNMLAIDEPVYTLYAHPSQFDQPPTAIAQQLAQFVNKPAPEVLTRLSRGRTGVTVAEFLPEETAERIEKLHLNGLELIQFQQRLYPQQDLFAGIVGYVDIDRKGQAGIEHSLETQLERPIQAVRLRRSGDGSLIPTGLPEGFLDQDNYRLVLTLDSRLQRAARYALEQQLDKYNAKRGTVLVMDVSDGALLTAVTEPSYDPNKYYETNVELFRNWAVSDLYEPGSTFKPINVAIALESGKVEADERFNDTGIIFFGRWGIENYDYDSRGARGWQNVTQILQHSSNVGMIRMMQKLSRESYYDWLRRLGIDDTMGMDLPFEGSGQLHTRQQFIESETNAAVVSFGNGLSLTPMKLLQLHGAIANGGRLVTPHVVRGLLTDSGQLLWQPKRPADKRIFSQETAQSVVSMMETVVNRGTGEPAKIPGYSIAGKTGTALKPNPNGGGYLRSRITSFVSILPADSPRYVVLVVIDDPKGDNAYGSTVAAPIAKAVMETLIDIENILPSQSVPSRRSENPSEEPEE